MLFFHRLTGRDASPDAANRSGATPARRLDHRRRRPELPVSYRGGGLEAKRRKGLDRSIARPDARAANQRLPWALSEGTAIHRISTRTSAAHQRRAAFSLSPASRAR